MSSFHRFGLNSSLVSRLVSLGITTPTPVQLTAINALTRRLPQDGDDPKWSFGREALVIDSATGSGKTLAYLLPLADLSLQSAGIAAAVAVPSATLATQVHDQAASLIGSEHVEFVDCTSKVSNPNSAIFIGQLSHLARLPSAIRDRLRCVVLDEADMILNPPGKYENYQRIKSRAPKRQAAVEALHDIMGGEGNAPTKHILEDDDNEDAMKSHEELDAALRVGSGISPLVVAVSATANNRLRHMLKVSKLAHRVKILSPTNASFDLPPNLQHRYQIVIDAAEDRIEIGVAPEIIKCFQQFGSRPTLVVAPDSFSLDMLRAALEFEGVEAIVIDEIASQDQSGFKMTYDGSKILIGSARSIRGLDIPIIEHVIIAAIPATTKDYVHIAGRTARMGRKGTVTTLLTAPSLGRLQTFAKELNVSIEQVDSKPNI